MRQRTKVLFIGNSFTFYSDIPDIFRKLADGAKESVAVESVTKGAYTLSKFADSADAFGKIVDDKLRSSDDYDVVILQEQSMRPLGDYDGFWTAVKSLKDKIENTQKNCRIYLYSTWGYAAGADSLGVTVVQMEQCLTDAYNSVAAETGTKVCYVGKAFSSAYVEHTEIDLYYTDAKHPSYAGAFLSACVHAATVLGINPCDSAFAGELDEQTASVLKQIALAAVAG